MKLKTFITELAILIGNLLLTWALIHFIFYDPKRSTADFEINFHDTYFVFAEQTAVTLLFFMMVTICYCIKEALFGFRRQLQNLILITSDFLFIVFVYPLSEFFKLIPNQGWTIYPPLSALGKASFPTYSQMTKYMTFMGYFKLFTSVIVIVFLVILIIISILTGKNWNNKPYESQKI
jgi:hypothetical protein